MRSAGIRRSERLRHVGDYRMEEFLGEGPHSAWQDWSAKHVSLKDDYRRVRIYPKATTEADARLTRSMAEREYQILRSLRHSAILEAQTFSDHDLGPAILFSREPDELRLDFYLEQFKNDLSLDRRLDLIRQIAEGLRYAHSRRVIRRALSPQSILVTRPKSDRPVLKIFNWQAGRDLGQSTSQRLSSVSVHLSDYLENASYVYMSPEALTDERNRSESADIFSLGAVAFHILTGRPPASGVHELQQVLDQHHALPLPAVMDSPARELEDLIRAATHADVSLRMSTASEFLEYLEIAEEHLTAPAFPENPLETSKDQLIYPGILVKKRLGSGGTAAAFLVETNGSAQPGLGASCAGQAKTCVLKIALKPEYNDRIRAEFEVLRQLRHDQIVAPIGDKVLDIRNLAGFLVEYAGERTLATYLRESGRVSLEVLQRFGVDLLEILHRLEQKGIPHRDLKPENIAVFQYGAQKEEHLRLFDFSLSQHRYDDFLAGTAEYRDPFLITRKRWDPQADRYSAALILYEMATGTLPKFGDGRSAPHSLTVEATIDSNLIDAAIRDSLTPFFRRALKRDAAERFETASEMALAWQNIFEGAKVSDSRPPCDAQSVAASIQSATLDTPIAQLGLGSRAESALDRENVLTVAQFLGLSIPRIRAIKGIGAETRKDLTTTLKLLRERFPEPEAAKTPVLTPETTANWSIDDVVARLLPKHTNRNQAEIAVISRLLGLAGDSEWPSQADVARATAKEPSQVANIVSKFRNRWREDSPLLTRARNLMAEFLAAHDGFIELSEMIAALIAARSSISEGAERTRRAVAVIRAATEAERSLSFEKQRFTDNRLKSPATGVIFTNPNAAITTPLSWVEPLAATARTLAGSDPLPSATRAIDSLRSIAWPAEIPPPPDARLLRLAATLSGAALSPRRELYPKRLNAETALRLASAALATPADESLTLDQIKTRVRDRYPEAEPLPDPPELDSLLERAGIDLRRDPNGVTYHPSPTTAVSTTYPYRARSTSSALPAATERDLDEAEKLDRTLNASLREHGFLVLTAVPKLLLPAIDELRNRFGTEVVNLDEALLAAMRKFATEKGIDWNNVVTADAEPENHPDHRKLEQLVSAVIPRVERELATRKEPLLLTFPGMLAAYNQLGIIERIRDNSGPAARWMLVASSAKDQRPTIDSKPVPVFSRAQWEALSGFWIKEHRSAELSALT
jgi:serine/threonine protein kinase